MSSLKQASPKSSEAKKTNAKNKSAQNKLDENGQSDATVIKKYPNRRLYNTATSAYITLHDIKSMVLRSERFIVTDAKSAKNITREILLQIILEEEAGAGPIFTVTMLEQMIRFYASAMSSVMGSFFEKNLQSLVDLQQQMGQSAQSAFGSSINPEMWTNYMRLQSPMLQSIFSNYLEQSKRMFSQMHENIHQSTADPVSKQKQR